MTVPAFLFSSPATVLPEGKTGWQAPSNIALVKYWGKQGLQLPKNPSLSFTLSHCVTRTFMTYTPKKVPSPTVDFEVFFENKKAEHFRPKIQTFFERIKPYVPFITGYHLDLHSQNTFPHSSGIASSASGMAALALCIMEMEKRLNPAITPAYFFQKAGFLARLGSGSAARSIQGPVMIWGEHAGLEESSDYFGIPNPFALHPVFENYQDTVLLVDKGQKKVSSSAGHNLMHNHPYAKTRFDQAHQNLDQLIGILKDGRLDDFVNLVESEALTLHAMMLTGMPYYILMRPNTLHIIEAVWEYRAQQNSHLCFTLDAGANVHLLYPAHEKEKVLLFIANHLSQYCKNGEYICDHTGRGATPL